MDLSADAGPRTVALLIPDLRGGGAERVTVSLAKEFLDRGYTVDIVVLQDVGEIVGLVPSQVRVVSLECSRFRHTMLPLISYLREASPDAVLAAMWPLTIIAIMAAKLSGCFCTVAVSDHTTLGTAYGKRGLLHGWLLRCSMALLCRLADARIGVSQGVVDDLACLSGIPSQHFSVIHNGGTC